MFVMGDKYPLPKTSFENDPTKAVALEEYRKRCQERGRISEEFNSAREFKEKAIHAVANIGRLLEEGSSVPKASGLVDEVLSMQGAELVRSLLECRWTLEKFVTTLSSRADQTLEVSQCLTAPQNTTWHRYLAAYVCSKVSIPTAGLISLGFDDELRWGQRCVLLTLLRVTVGNEREQARRLLLKKLRKDKPHFARLALLGLGHLHEPETISEIVRYHKALQSSYDNQKLGSFVMLALLHCYIDSISESSDWYVLEQFNTMAGASKGLNNYEVGFYDALDEFQTLRPGRAAPLFRYFRDNNQREALRALLVHLGSRPNPLLVGELIALGNTDATGDIPETALQAAAYAGTPQAEVAIEEAVSAGRPGSEAALSLIQGVRRTLTAGQRLERIVRAASFSQPEPAGDVTWNSLWAIGELGVRDT